jgi:hypothetical protein
MSNILSYLLDAYLQYVWSAMSTIAASLLRSILDRSSGRSDQLLREKGRVVRVNSLQATEVTRIDGEVDYPRGGDDTVLQVPVAGVTPS